MSHPHRHPRKKPSSALPRVVYRWHRRIGLSAAIFLVWMVISGWLLNHSGSLNLAQHQMHSPALASWYNLHYTLPTQVFVTKDHWVANGDENVFVDGKKISVSLNTPIGFAQSENLIAIANNTDIILLNEKSELVDKLQAGSLPINRILHIGSGCAGIVISDNSQQLSTTDGIDWQRCAEAINWSHPQAINTTQLAQIQPLLVPNISIEKLLIDLHTGRFFGSFGVYLVDTIGACLLLLALSGIWMFFRLGKK